MGSCLEIGFCCRQIVFWTVREKKESRVRPAPGRGEAGAGGQSLEGLPWDEGAGRAVPKEESTRFLPHVGLGGGGSGPGRLLPVRLAHFFFLKLLFLSFFLF